jgi:hypothetical protein
MVMPNAVSLNGQGYIVQVYEGDQTDEFLAVTITQTQQYIDTLAAKGKPVNLLVDAARLGKVTTASRKYAVHTMMHLPYDHIAVCGANTFNKALLNLIAHAAGRSRHVRFFKTQQLAEKWLGQNGK